MKLFQYLGLCGLILVVSACQLGQGPGHAPIQTDEQPTPTPWAGPTPTPVPTPTVVVSPFPAHPDGLEFYSGKGFTSGKFFCDTLENSLKANPFEKLADLAVSADGQTVYVLRARLGNQKPDYGGDHTVVPRQFVYRISSQGELTVISSQGEYPYNCQLGEEIEKDPAGNLYLDAPIFDPYSPNIPPVLVHRFIKLDPVNNRFSEVGRLELEKPDPSPSGLPPARDLKGLYIRQNKSVAQELYYSLLAPAYSGRDSFIQKYSLEPSKSENLVNFYSNDSRMMFAVKDELIIGSHKVLPPYPTLFDYNNSPYKERLVPLFSDNFGGAISHLRVDETRQILYFSDSWLHSVWKVDLSLASLNRLAGNGTPGFSDGQGGQASFNTPGALDLDAEGNVYVADVNNQAIRKITPLGQVSTFYRYQPKVP